MKVLLCTNVYPPNFIGGAELVVHNHAKALIKLGHDVRVFAGEIGDGLARYETASGAYDNVTVHRVKLVAEDFASDYLNISHPPVERLFSELLEEFCPDVVHCHNLVGLSVGLLGIARKFGAKVVLTVHDHWGYCFKNTAMKSEGVACLDFTKCHECQPYINQGADRKIPQRLRRDFLKYAMEQVDDFVSPSAYLAKSYVRAGVSEDRVHVVWNGIELDRFSNIKRRPSEKVRFSFFGYFGRHKGIHVLLDALPLMRNRDKVIVNLVGDGDQRNAYVAHLAANGCSAMVKFMGKIDHLQVTSAYEETDVLVLPSIWHENQPVSICEAMACGLPVIASRMGGMPELVEHMVTGILFESKHAYELAQAMDFLIAQPALRIQLGAAGKNVISGSQYDVQVSKLEKIYLTERRTSAKNSPVILCVGAQFSSVCERAIQVFQDEFADLELNLVMAECIPDAYVDEISFVWVVDPRAHTNELEPFKHSNLPIMLPSTMRVETDITGSLTYADEFEAAATISYLLIYRSDLMQSIANYSSSVRDDGDQSQFSTDMP